MSYIIKTIVSIVTKLYLKIKVIQYQINKNDEILHYSTVNQSGCQLYKYVQPKK